MDIISWTYWIYSMMDWPLLDVSVLVWRILSRGGYQAMWCVVSLCWPGSIVGWVHWPAHWSRSPVVELACEMTPNSSFSFPCCMFCSRFPYSCLLLMCNAYAEIGLLVLIYHVCSQCHILSISKFGQHMICYMFCIVIYIFR